MIYITLIFAYFIGLAHSVFGGGGNILTVPVLVFILGYDTKQAIASSLFIVGISSFIGTINSIRRKELWFKETFLLGMISMFGAFAGARLAQTISGDTQLLMFSVATLSAAYFMLTKAGREEPEEKKQNSLFVVFIGLPVGIFTSMIGVGGGFLFVPILVLLGSFPVKRAIASSIMLVSMNSFAGFLGYLDQVDLIASDIFFYLVILLAGFFAGFKVKDRIDAANLKKGFAVMLIFVALFVLSQKI